MYDLKDKIVLITGGAKGIGAAISREVLKEGAKHLRILDLDETSGIQLQNELNKQYGAGKTKFIKCDVSKDDQLFGIFYNTKEEQGYLDVVINNAAVANEVDYAAIRQEIEVNLIAVINGTLKATELMDPKNGGRGGTVINVASVAGLYPACPPMFGYCTTKAAVLQFTSCIGKIQSEAIRVIAICYSNTVTEIYDNMFTFKRAGDDVISGVVLKRFMQSVESAARGTIEAYKKGKSASTWLIQYNESAVDITEDIEKCHQAMVKLLRR